MPQLWRSLALILYCQFCLTACIVLPESTAQSTSTTRVYVNDRAGPTQVEISRPQIIVVQPSYTRLPQTKQNCHMQANGQSMPPFPVVCN